jgi:phosphatidate cytidylyltransferase
MLRTRLWMGAILIALAVAVLFVDRWLAPAYPFLFILVASLAGAAAVELTMLVRAGPVGGAAPSRWFVVAGVLFVVAANWPAHVLPLDHASPWAWVAGAFALAILATFLREMATFREPGQSVVRVALALWITAYLGILTSFVVQLRWLPDLAADEAGRRGSLALALAIFVPKFGDSGAYFAGRLFGRHKMTPVLSPKKTWEGAAGAAAGSMLTAVAINALGPVVRGGWLAAAAVGFVVGAVGLLGDLAESLVKRDCQQKDASQVMPGFGGVLDVVDSVIFAGPVTYGLLLVA